MPINEIQFFFCALGAFGSLCFGLYLLIFSSLRKLEAGLVGWIVLLIGLRVSISCLYFFSFHFSWSLVQVGLIAHLFSAILLFVYSNDYWKKVKFRFLIILGFTAVLVFSIVYSFEKFPSIWDHEIRYIIHLMVTICVLFSAIVVFKNNTPFQAARTVNGMVLIFYSIYCLGFSISLFTNYSLGPLLYSILSLFSLIFLFRHFGNKKESRKKYSNKKLSSTVTKYIEKGLQEYLIEKKIFVNPRLKISDVANILGISTHELSEYLNDVQKVSYPNYIKRLRVEEAKRLLMEINNLSVEGVGFEAGFNSRSSFFSTFKNLTHVTPTAYKRSKMSSTL